MQFTYIDQLGDDIAAPERPMPRTPTNPLYGSDQLAMVLRELDLPYMALNAGASH